MKQLSINCFRGEEKIFEGWEYFYDHGLMTHVVRKGDSMIYFPDIIYVMEIIDEGVTIYEGAHLDIETSKTICKENNIEL